MHRRDAESAERVRTRMERGSTQRVPDADGRRWGLGVRNRGCPLGDGVRSGLTVRWRWVAPLVLCIVAAPPARAHPDDEMWTLPSTQAAPQSQESAHADQAE